MITVIDLFTNTTHHYKNRTVEAVIKRHVKEYHDDSFESDKDIQECIDWMIKDLRRHSHYLTTRYRHGDWELILVEGTLR